MKKRKVDHPQRRSRVSKPSGVAGVLKNADGDGPKVDARTDDSPNVDGIVEGERAAGTGHKRKRRRKNALDNKVTEEDRMNAEVVDSE